MNPKRLIPIFAVGMIVAASGAGFFLSSSHDKAVAAEAAEVQKKSVLTVTAVSPSEEEWPQTIETSGAIAAWHEAVIGAEVGGLQITDVLVDVGDKVSQGQELARLSSESPMVDVHKKEAAVAQAKAALESAKANAARTRKIKDKGALSDQQITDYLTAEESAAANLASAEADLENARITLRKTSVQAVDDGVITSRSATLGQVASAGTEMFRLLRQGRIEWNAEVDAQQLQQIRPDQKAVVTLPDGTRIEGRVRVASPSLNTNTSRAIVYVSLPSDCGASAGTFVNGSLELDPKKALTVPQSAIVLRDGRSYLFVLNNDSTVSKRPVQTGRYREGRVEVLDGLDPSIPVVESGGAFLSEGSAVTVSR